MTTWLDKTYDHAAALDMVSAQLTILADAFYVSGNTVAATKLYDHARTIEIEAKRSRELVGERVDTDFKQAQESSATVLRAALAVSKIK